MRLKIKFNISDITTIIKIYSMLNGEKKKISTPVERLLHRDVALGIYWRIF